MAFCCALALFTNLSISIHLFTELLSLMEGVPFDMVGGSQGKGVALPSDPSLPDVNKPARDLLEDIKDQFYPQSSRSKIPDLNEDPDDDQKKELKLSSVLTLYSINLNKRIIEFLRKPKSSRKTSNCEKSFLIPINFIKIFPNTKKIGTVVGKIGSSLLLSFSSFF